MELLPHLITNALLQNILERLADGEVVIGDGSYCNTLEKRGYCKVNKRGYCKVNKRGYCKVKKRGYCKVKKRGYCKVNKRGY